MLRTKVVGYGRAEQPLIFASQQQRKLVDNLIKLSSSSDEDKSDLLKIVSGFFLRSSVSKNSLTSLFASIFPDIESCQVPTMQASYEEIECRLTFYRLKVSEQKTFHQMKAQSKNSDDFCMRVYRMYRMLVFINCECIAFLNMMEYLSPPPSAKVSHCYLEYKSRVTDFIKHDRISQLLVCHLATLLDVFERVERLGQVPAGEQNENQRRLGFY